MSVETNKTMVLRYYEAFNNGEDSRFDEFFNDDFVDHKGFLGQPKGPDGVREGYRFWRTAFPDTKVTIEDIICEDDKVMVRTIARATHQGDFLGISATGKEIEVEGISIFQIVSGRIQERWGLTDAEKLEHTLHE